MYIIFTGTQCSHIVLYVNTGEGRGPDFSNFAVFIPRHTIVAGYYDFTLDVRVSVRPSVSCPSVFRFRMIT